jgi:hypothetical protein
VTNVALDLTVDHALTWPELRPGKFAYAFARHGVLPLSAGDLAGSFPDLWPNRKSAEEALRWAGRKLPGVPQIDILFGIIRVIWPGLVKATYRRKSQRGPAARALVRADLPDPRAVLEDLVGELTEFHTESPPGRPQDTASAPEPRPPKPLRALPAIAAALSAESHLLASLPSDARPPDMLGMARVMKLMALTTAAAGVERAAAA